MIATVSQEVTQEMLELAAGDIRSYIRASMTRKMEELAPPGTWTGEPVFREIEYIRQAGIYADDADWDDEDLEPIGYEDQPMVHMDMRVHFTPLDTPQM